jgi:hypothetical protein
MRNQQPQQQRQWWAPIWKGLVMDQDAKHCRQIKAALWLYLYLLLNANRGTGVLARKIETISRDMGVPRGTIVRWLDVLRTQGYVETTNTGRSLTIQVARWKPIGQIAKSRHQKSRPISTRYTKYATTGEPEIQSTSLHNSSSATAANKTIVKINLINEMRDGGRHGRSCGEFEAVGTLAGRETLAQELAKALDDSTGIELYRSYCRRFPERHLRDVLSEVQRIPTEQITKGRGALFTYLVQNYVKGTNEDLGN